MKINKIYLLFLLAASLVYAQEVCMNNFRHNSIIYLHNELRHTNIEMASLQKSDNNIHFLIIYDGIEIERCDNMNTTSIQLLNSNLSILSKQQTRSKK